MQKHLLLVGIMLMLMGNTACAMEIAPLELLPCTQNERDTFLDIVLRQESEGEGAKGKNSSRYKKLSDITNAIQKENTKRLFYWIKKITEWDSEKRTDKRSSALSEQPKENTVAQNIERLFDAAEELAQAANDDEGSSYLISSDFLSYSSDGVE